MLSRLSRSFYSTNAASGVLPPAMSDRTIATTKETVLYFDNIFPIKYGRFDPRWLYSHQVTMVLNWDKLKTKANLSGRLSPILDGSARNAAASTAKKDLARDYTWLERFNINHLLPDALLSEPGFRVSKVVFCERDGGLFLKCAHSGPEEHIFEPLQHHLSNFGHVAWFNLQQIQVYRVHGKPFLDDMRSVQPSSRIRVTFTGPPGADLSLEQVYAAFRLYGEIADITFPPPASTKDGPKYCFVQYSRVRAAARAKSCLHNARLPLVEDDSGKSALVNIAYEPRVGAQTIWNWLSNHPRVAISLGLAALTGLSYLVWDPVRMFFITNKITDRFSLEWTSFMGMSPRVKEHLRHARREPENESVLPGQRAEAEANRDQPESNLLKTTTTVKALVVQSSPDEETDLEQSPDQTLRNIFLESPQTFSLVNGPHGSGKAKIVADAMKSRPYKLVIDCEDLANASDENRLLEKLAKDVGFFPSFAAFQSLNYWIETLIAGTTGVKPGISSNASSTFTNILETTSAALSRITQKQLKAAAVASDSAADSEQKKRAVEYPIVIIRNFMNKEKTKHTFVFDALVQWAAYLTENGIAHVVFLSTNQSAQRFLSKSAAGSRSAQTITLSDASIESAYSYMKRALGSEVVASPEMAGILGSLGGRLTDLESFAHRVSNGMSLKDAYNDLLLRSLSEVRKVAFDMDEAGQNASSKAEWTLPQLWTVIKLLAKQDTVDFDRIKFSAHFSGNENPLRALESCHLINIVLHNGRPGVIKPAKPIYQAAFQEMVEDDTFAAALDIQSIKALLDVENANIAKYESELNSLQPWVAHLKAKPAASKPKWYNPFKWSKATPQTEYPEVYSPAEVIQDQLALAIEYRLTFLGQQLQAAVKKVRQLTLEQQKAKEKIKLV